MTRDTSDYAWYHLQCRTHHDPARSCTLRLEVADYFCAWYAATAATDGKDDERPRHAYRHLGRGPLPSPVEDRFRNDWNEVERGLACALSLPPLAAERGGDEGVGGAGAASRLHDVYLLVSSLGMVKGEWQLRRGSNMADERKGLLGVAMDASDDEAGRCCSSLSPTEVNVVGVAPGLEGERAQYYGLSDAAGVEHHDGVDGDDDDHHRHDDNEDRCGWQRVRRGRSAHRHDQRHDDDDDADSADADGACRCENEWPRWYRATLRLPSNARMPSVYEHGIVLDLAGDDSLDTGAEHADRDDAVATGLDKGYLYVNGASCGRYWLVRGTHAKNGFLLLDAHRDADHDGGDNGDVDEGGHVDDHCAGGGDSGDDNVANARAHGARHGRDGGAPINQVRVGALTQRYYYVPPWVLQLSSTTTTTTEEEEGEQEIVVVLFDEHGKAARTPRPDRIRVLYPTTTTTTTRE